MSHSPQYRSQVKYLCIKLRTGEGKYSVNNKLIDLFTIR